jgi:hypothetical protein
MKVVGLAVAAIVLLPNIVSLAVAQPNSVTVGVIEQLSGSRASRGQQFVNVYKKNVDAANLAGGVLIGGTRYKIGLVTKDSAGDPARANAMAQEAVVRDKAVSLLCHSIGCREAAERNETPTILTEPAFKLTTPGKRIAFVINVPSPDDFEAQAELAYHALQQAIANSGRPSAEQIITALRNLNLNTEFGRVRFDELGNNIGLVRFPFRSGSRPDAAGCSNSCGSTCPNNCGQIACSKDSNNNQCCSICGRPLPQ